MEEWLKKAKNNPELQLFIDTYLNEDGIEELVEYVEKLTNYKFNYLDVYDNSEIMSEVYRRYLDDEFIQETSLRDFSDEEILDYVDNHITHNSFDIFKDKLYLAIIETEYDQSRTELEKIVMKELGIMK